MPAAIEQLGAKLAFIDQDELAWGDLSKHDVIVTGVRAYERRTDLRAYNRRLLDYAERGGIVIVQYNKMEFNQADYGPYPAKVSGNRVSDETVPVNVLVPAHPAFNYPNKIGPAAWEGWVQERGLYFLGDKDRSTSIWCRWWIRTRIIRGKSAGRWSKESSARGGGSTSVSPCGASCRPEPPARINSWPT